MATLVERTQMVIMSVPIDAGAAAVTCDWIDMSLYQHCTVIFAGDIGTAGDDPTLTLLQASDNAGTGSKALTFTRIWEKEGATAINAIGTFTARTQAAANTYVSATGGENEQLIVLEIDSDQLDTANNFNHISMTIADVGAAGKLICVLAILSEPRFAQAATPTAIG